MKKIAEKNAMKIFKLIDDQVNRLTNFGSLTNSRFDKLVLPFIKFPEFPCLTRPNKLNKHSKLNERVCPSYCF